MMIETSNSAGGFEHADVDTVVLPSWQIGSPP